MTELSTSMIVFLILLVIFQIIALRTYKNDLLWMISDYLWLGIAVLGIISLSADARKDEARRLIPNQNNYWQAKASLAEQELNFTLNFLTVFMTITVIDEPPHITKQKQEFATLKERLLSYLNSMKDPNWSKNLDSFHHREMLLEKLTDSMAIKQANNISDAFDRVTKSYQELLDLEARLRLTIWEELKVYLGPILIAFALAVRFGKTTADMMRKQKS
jgi:hypothetical protein